MEDHPKKYNPMDVQRQAKDLMKFLNSQGKADFLASPRRSGALVWGPYDERDSGYIYG